MSDDFSSASWLCGLLQTNDSFYPTGSYAHSFGLEGLVHEGVITDRESLHAFVFQSVLPALRHNDLPLAAQAWRAFVGPDWIQIAELSELSAALKTAKEARQATENIGRQRAELVVALHPCPLAREYLERALAGRWPFAAPISAALEGQVLGAPLPAVLASVYYSSVVSLLASAMKLLRIGQNSCQTLLADALGRAPADLAFAANVPVDEIGWFNPWVDIAAARHETADGRLFIS
jgi:urease accessory protein